MMKNILLTFAIFLLANHVYGQRFLATIDSDLDTLIFKISPTGGNITTNWSDIEFFVRWPDNSPAFTFGDIVVNYADFPGISIPDNGNDAQGSEVGYTNNWFGTSFSTTSSQTYHFGTDYWVFKVAVNGPAQAANVDFELCHNTNFAPFYLALTSGAGNDLTASGSNLKFFGTNAQICGPANCPASTPGNNHVASLDAPLPVELIHFEVSKYQEQDAYLEWTTSAEINSSHFEIERSTDAQNWELIAMKEASGDSNTEQRYLMIDEQVFAPSSLQDIFYYRLKIVDLDSSFKYSDIRSVQFDRPAPTWKVYPNPTSEGIYLNVETTNSTNIMELRMYDVVGRLIIKKQYESQNLETPYYLNLTQENVIAGTYFLQLFEGQQQVLSERLVVQGL